MIPRGGAGSSSGSTAPRNFRHEVRTSGSIPGDSSGRGFMGGIGSLVRTGAGIASGIQALRDASSGPAKSRYGLSALRDAAPTPTPPTTSGGGGGRVTVPGGVGRVGAQSVQAARNQRIADMERAMEQARAEVERQQAAAREDYERQRDELRAEFDFAETAQEKAALAAMLEDLEEQREVAEQSIAEGYSRAIEQAQETGAGMRESAIEEGARIGGVFSDAQASLSGQLDESADEWAAGGAGLGVGMDGGGDAADDFVALLAGEGARSQALSEQLGGIAAEDADWLGATFEGEREAQQADLGRLAMSTRAAQQQSHQQRVSDRIAAERGQWRDQLAGLQGSFRDRGFALGDQSIGLHQQSADQAFQAGESAADRQQQASQANAQMAMEAQRMNQAAAQAQNQMRFRASQAAADRAAQQQGSDLFGPGEQRDTARFEAAMSLGVPYTKYMNQRHGWDVSLPGMAAARNGVSGGGGMGGLISSIGRLFN